MQRPPPLQLLPPFEAAARLSSFKLAAQELNVTPSAVSQQVRALEQWLELRLFVRLTRGIELTSAGQQFHEVATRVLSEYDQRYERFRVRQQRPVLRVSMIPFIAHELILPRLQEFQRLNPEVDLRIETSMSLVDFAMEPIDAALRLGKGPWPGLASFPLCDTTATLVGSPELVQRQPLSSLEDLSSHTLIHSRREQDDWQQVALRAGIELMEGQKALILDDYFSAMQAAANGIGLAIAVLPVTNRWIRDGRLAQATPPMPTDLSFQFVCRREKSDEPEIRAFYQWVSTLFDEVAVGQ